MNTLNKQLAILRVDLSIGETNATYNQFMLPVLDRHDISLCTYFKVDLTPHEAITFFEGDGSFTGFFRTLKTALSAREYDIIHVHAQHVGVFLLIAMLLWYKRVLPNVVYTMHNSYQNFKLRNKLLLIPIFATFPRVVCCGQASLESLPSFLRLLAGRRLRAVPNGVNIDRVDHVISNQTQCADDGEFSVASVGRLKAIKNPLAVLEAFDKSADQTDRLTFIGDGELYEQILQKSKNLDRELQVELTRKIPREEVYTRLNKADIFISTSRGEGLPIAVLEAMLCRCPVILSDIPPHREIVGSHNFIPLLDPDDVEGFAREIKRFNQMSATDRLDIGGKCRKLVEEQFGLMKMHERYENIYTQLLLDP